MLISMISWKSNLIGWRQPAEGVSCPHRAVTNAVRRQNPTHINTRAAAPHAGFDNVARDRVGDYSLEEKSDVAHTHRTNHGLSTLRPVAANCADICIKPPPRPRAFRRIIEEQTYQRFFEQIEI